MKSRAITNSVYHTLANVFFFNDDNIILDKKTISIVGGEFDKFDISTLKKKIANAIQDNEYKADNSTGLCKNLECRCIATQSEIDFYLRNPNKDKNVKHGKGKQLENDVSNVCLKIMSFLMLKGDLNNNLDKLFRQSLNFLDKQRGPNEIMVEVFYPTYIALFEPTYHRLSKESNYSDPFTYDQRVDGTNSLFTDENEGKCYNDETCKDALTAIVSTWRKVMNVMSFDWKMGIGSMVSNFHYLMMMCSNEHWLQTDEEMWAPNTKLFNAPCHLSEGAKELNRLMQPLTEDVSSLPFKGIYLNDLIGYLGYSSTFDLQSLEKDKYVYNARSLHPITGMDAYINEAEEGWKQCNYFATYQNWVKHTSNLDEGKGKV